MEKPMNNRRLPQTDSIEELAKFWDANDITDFEDELEEVDDCVFERENTIIVHLPADDASTVRAMAKSRGVGESDLVRQWVLDKLHAT
jgi:hypothetical protein